MTDRSALSIVDEAEAIQRQIRPLRDAHLAAARAATDLYTAAERQHYAGQTVARHAGSFEATIAEACDGSASAFAAPACRELSCRAFAEALRAFGRR